MHLLNSGYQLRDLFQRRKSFCGDFDFFHHIPDLADFHKKAYQKCLDKDTPYNKRKNQGLEKIFRTFFPIYQAKSKITVDYLGYELQEPRYSIDDCIIRNISYTSTLKMLIRITSAQNNQSQELWVMVGEVPIMLDKGTFIVSGHEKIFIAKAQRCPGVLFMKEIDTGSEKISYLAKVYPNIGAWLHIKAEKDTISISINKKKKFSLTTFLLCFPKKATDYEEIDEEFDIKDILDQFNPSINITKNNDYWQIPFDQSKYKKTPVPFNIYVNNKLVIPAKTTIETTIKLPKIIDVPQDDIVGSFIAEDIYDKKTGEIFVEIGSRISLENLEDLKDCTTLKLYLVNDDYSSIILNTLQIDKITTRNRALFVWAQSIKMGTHYGAYGLSKIFNVRFFDPRYYDLESYGRYKLNDSLNLNKTEHYLTFDDLIATTKQLMLFSEGKREEDEIDSLSNKRVRLVDEIIENFFRLGTIKLEKSLKDKLHTFDFSKAKIADVLNFRILMYSVVEGFYKFSHMYDDNNGFSGLVQSRKIVYSGASSSAKERVYGSLRDVNVSKFGRICSVQTPEGKKTGLLEHLALYSQPDKNGFLCTLYYAVKNGIVSDIVEKISPKNEKGKIIVSKSEYHYQIIKGKKNLIHNKEYIVGHKDGETGFFHYTQVDFVFIAPQNQIFSISCSLIPFPGHCDPYRVLSAANMNCQALPLIKDESPFVSAGMEHFFSEKIIAKRDGKVIKVDCYRIVIEAIDDDAIVDVYKLVVNKKTNSDTCMTQKALVDIGDEVKAGDLIGDGFTVKNGELSLGKNLLVVYQSNPWCYEDAFVLSDRLIEQDELTSINLEIHECQVLEGRFGPEKCTRDVPGVNDEFLVKLDECGIINTGAEVRGGDIVVGKITPTGGVGHVAPEQKLLRMIFGEKMFECSDSSLKLPHGTNGTVVKVKIITRKGVEKDDKTILQDKMELDEINNDYNDKTEIIESSFLKKINKLTDSSIDLNLKVSNIKLDKIIDAITNKEKKIEAKNLVNNMKLMIEQLNKERDKQIKNFLAGIELPEGVIKLIRIYIASRKVIEPGDKLCGRYGNKGVISNIMPRCDMPYLADGTPADIIINPLGLLARMNLGQVLETSIGYAIYELRKNIGLVLRQLNMKEFQSEYTGNINKLKDLIVLAIGDNKIKLGRNQATNDEDWIFIGQQLFKNGIRVKLEQFKKFTNEDLTKILIDFGADPSGKVTVYDGKTGEPFKSKLLVGYQFILKLCHMVSLKLHARSVGPYSLINLQPLGGRARFGGQRFGEMEVWALEAYGAAFNCNELLTVKADDLLGRKDVFSQFIKNKTYSLILMNNARQKMVSEGFKLLVFELRAAGFDLVLMDNQNNLILNI